MARNTLARLLIAALAASAMGAPCGTVGPSSRDFAAGSLVIPMDRCFQRTSREAPPGGASNCNATGDDGVYRAYGLVYFLLRNGVTVYWAIDPTKSGGTGITAVDVTVPAPGSGSVAQKMSWTNGSFADLIPAGSPVSYIGGPFVVDSLDAAKVVKWLTDPTDPLHADFTRFQAEALVDIHRVQNAFTAAQVRPLVGPPPRLAILNIKGRGAKTSVDVMYKYARSAGLDWACTDTSGDCAGGVLTNSGVCSRTALYDYLAANGVAAGSVHFNDGPGRVYDVLCDSDFLPDYTNSSFGQGGYKLLWAPHWEAGNIDPSGTTADSNALRGQLQTIAEFVDRGNNLFAECHAIVTLEGGNGTSGDEVGHPVTRFHTTGGMFATNDAFVSGTDPAGTEPNHGGANRSGAFEFLVPSHPNVQIADFPFTLVSGSITSFYPDRVATASVYRSTPDGARVERLIAQTTVTPPWDVSTLYRKDGATAKGAVAYLGGHDYSGQTAGTRMVLNTLFNLGIACSNPGTACNTGQLGVCAAGTLRCATSGGLECARSSEPGPEVCDDGLDNNCDGQVDEGCGPPPACVSGTQRPCPGGPPSVGVCQTGSQTCTGGVWGACQDQVLPGIEACNGKDDDCNGQTDEGTLCPTGVCSNGVCLPATCGPESRCPAGYECVASGQSFACQPLPCVGGNPCPAGEICSAGACVDPCLGVLCGPGSTCSGGSCFGGACYTVACAAPDVCRQGQCTADPCATVTCAEGTFCREGECVRSCSTVTCPAGQTCGFDGFCAPDCAATCAAGQVCQSGSCVADPCAGVGCGTGQVCRDGACVDPPCSGVTCPTGSSCSDGQCHPTSGSGSPSSVAKVTRTKSGGCGCGSTGGVELLGGLATLALWPRLRRRPRRPGNGPLPGIVALVLLSTLGLAACGKSSKVEVCPDGSTACGEICCAASYVCTAGSCAFPTDNPFLTSIDPPASGVGTSITLTFAGERFQQGARVRIVGAGLDVDRLLTIASPTEATLPSLDLTSALPGSADVRVVNPGLLSSNTMTFTVGTTGVVLGAISPARGRQDQTIGPLTLSGSGFASGLTATFAPLAGGTPRSFQPSAVTVDSATIASLDLSTLAIGAYRVAVTNPGGTPSNGLTFSVNEAAPVLTALNPTSGQAGTLAFSGTATGQNLYPSSVLHVSGPGLADSPLPTTCAFGTDALGKCVSGTLNVSIDLTLATAGSYTVWVVNPGSPASLSSGTLPFTVTP